MMSPFLPLIAFVVSTQAHFVGTPTAVSADDLAYHVSRYEGKRVSVHACLIKSPHGDSIARCDSKDWHDLSPVISAPGHDDILFKPYSDLHRAYSDPLEADFSGVVVRQDDKWPRAHSQLFLSIDTLKHARFRAP